ncbi:MBL fold metallo-hydrolase [Stygiolobus caldivivus]|uniref:MBL fold metallo-hydrolase n=1 Tax=Stygiolobus caldivivus TaxID=2824673 RepID=A0A8D5U5G5_9CREN|nr:MBL fold metallo-hydrolase [Stygiolobus caldivivus]BCU69413.1 MBL fold metallo-hydrolase [Stygiolobus caldivivus]
MKLVFLGTGAGATFGSKRMKASIYVKGTNTSLVLDMGTGSNFKLEDLGLLAFSTLFITHLHIDHFNGLFDHLVQRKLRGLPQLKVYSPHGLSEIFDRYVKYGNNILAEITESDLPTAEIGEFQVYSVKGCHSIYDVAYVVSDGKKKVLYTGDTAEPCESILSEAEKVDIVVHESSCLDDCSKWGHTSLKQLLELFPKEKLILTHIPAQIEDEVKRLAKGYNIAYDGLIVDV